MTSPSILIISKDTVCFPYNKTEVPLFSFLNDSSIQSRVLAFDHAKTGIVLVFKAEACLVKSERVFDLILGKAYRIPDAILTSLKRIFESRQIRIQKICIQNGIFSWTIESSQKMALSFLIIPMLVAIFIGMMMIHSFNLEYRKLSQTLLQTEHTLKLASNITKLSSQETNTSLLESYFSLFQILGDYPLIIKTLSLSEKNFLVIGYLDNTSLIFPELVQKLNDTFGIQIETQSQSIHDSILLCTLQGSFLE